MVKHYLYMHGASEDNYNNTRIVMQNLDFFHNS